MLPSPLCRLFGSSQAADAAYIAYAYRVIIRRTSAERRDMLCVLVTMGGLIKPRLRGPSNQCDRCLAPDANTHSAGVVPNEKAAVHALHAARQQAEGIAGDRVEAGKQGVPVTAHMSSTQELCQRACVELSAASRNGVRSRIAQGGAAQNQGKGSPRCGSIGASSSLHLGQDGSSSPWPPRPGALRIGAR